MTKFISRKQLMNLILLTIIILVSAKSPDFPLNEKNSQKSSVDHSFPHTNYDVFQDILYYDNYDDHPTFQEPRYFDDVLVQNGASCYIREPGSYNPYNTNALYVYAFALFENMNDGTNDRIKLEKYFHDTPMTKGYLEFNVSVSGYWDSRLFGHTFYFMSSLSPGNTIVSSVSVEKNQHSDYWHIDLRDGGDSSGLSEHAKINVKVTFEDGIFNLFIDGVPIFTNVASTNNWPITHIMFETSVIENVGSGVYDYIKIGRQYNNSFDEQDFNEESLDLTPENWNVTDNPLQGLTMRVKDSYHANSPYPTRNLFLDDNQSTGNINSVKNFSNSLTEGEFRTDFYVNSALNDKLNYSVNLEDSSGNCIISNKIEKNSSENFWVLKIQNQSYVINNLNGRIRLHLSFYNSNLSAWINDSLLFDHAYYQNNKIEQIHIRSELDSNGGNITIDYLNFTRIKDFLNRPDSPELFSVETPNNNGNFLLNWSYIPGANGYYVFKDSFENPNYHLSTPIYNCSNTQIMIEGEIPQNTWFYCIVAYNSMGNSSISNWISVEVSYPIESPTIIPLSTPDYDGDFTIDWNSVQGATRYLLYRKNYNFSNVEGLTPIYNGTNSEFSEVRLDEGEYYYAVIAANEFVHTTLSQRVPITVDWQLTSPILNGPNSPDTDGDYSLSWTTVNYITEYHLYRSNSEIISIDSATLIYSGPDTAYSESGVIPGIYYYALVASNGTDISNVSQNVAVSVEYSISAPILSSIPAINYDNWIYLSWNSLPAATAFLIYIHSSPITEINATVEEHRYSAPRVSTSMYRSVPGCYYFAVAAEYSNLTSSLSNNVYTDFQFPGSAPGLSLDKSNINTEINYTLSWNEVQYATYYKLIYTDDYQIISGFPSIATTIYEGPNLEFNHTGLSNGTYYYMIKAFNSETETHYSSVLTVILPEDGFDQDIPPSNETTSNETTSNETTSNETTSNPSESNLTPSDDPKGIGTHYSIIGTICALSIGIVYELRKERIGRRSPKKTWT